MKRILIDSHGPDPQAARIAYATAIAEAAKSEVRTIILLVPVLKGWESTVPAEVLGKSGAKELLRDGSIVVGNARIEIHSIQTLQKGAQGKILLAVHVRPEVLEKAVQLRPSLKSCIYLPWMPDEIALWKALPPDEIKNVSGEQKNY